VTRPRLLELFCGAGGAGMGYHRAGFEVVGVDIEPHPGYPFKFHQRDAMEVLGTGCVGHNTWLMDFDVIHASPPCQASTTMSNRWRGAGGRADEHINLIPQVVGLLTAWGGPWVVENVPGARADLTNAFTLTGGMFGLGVHRPRLFGSNTLIMCPPKAAPPEDALGVYGKAHDGRRLFTRANGSIQRAAGSLTEAQAAMGIDWMGWDDLREAVPPAYTEYIGRQLLAHVLEGAA
jgi:DNA (cytosine-5)-methyltransferase 1